MTSEAKPEPAARKPGGKAARPARARAAAKPKGGAATARPKSAAAASSASASSASSAAAEPARSVSARAPAAKAPRAKAAGAAKAPVVASARKPGTPRVPAPPATGPLTARADREKPAAGADEAGVVQTLRRKDLVDRVVKSSGAKKKAVREIVEATLKVLGDALEAGETLALPPFGKAKVNRHRDLGTAEMLTVKLRRKAPRKSTPRGSEPLAEPAE